MNRLFVGLIGAAAVAAAILLVRQQRGDAVHRQARNLPTRGDAQAAQISLERMRALGL